MKCWKKNLCRVNAHGKDTNCTWQRALPCKSARQRPTGARQSLLCLVLCLCRVPASIFFISFLFYLFQNLYWLFKYDQCTTSWQCVSQYFCNTISTPPPSNIRVSEQTAFGESVISVHPSNVSKVTPASYVVHHYTFHHNSTHILGPHASFGGIPVLRQSSPLENGGLWAPAGLPP